MPDNAEANELRAPLTFSGHTVQKGCLSPRDFLTELEDRQRRYNWDQEKTMQTFIASLRGDAAAWFNKNLPMACSITKRAELRVNWTTCAKLEFKKYFNIDSTQTGVAWSNISKQAHNETAQLYFNRAISTIHTRLEVRTGIPLMEPATLSQAHKDCIETIAAADRQGFKDAIAKLASDSVERGRIDAMCDAAKFLMAQGLTDPVLKSKANEINLRLDNTKTLHDFTDEIEALERVQDAAKAKHGNGSNNGSNGNSNGRYKKVHAVSDEAPLCEDIGEDEEADYNVDAVYNKKTSKNNGNGAKNKSAGSKRKCEFCGYTNHVLKDCNFMKRSAADRTSAVKNKRLGNASAPAYAHPAKPPAPFAASQVSHAEQPYAAYQASDAGLWRASGNANGW
jgi:hypothetical protein